MMFYIGENKFREGIRFYLKKYREKNTVLEDFLSCMSSASGIDIVGWSKQWLETTGVNAFKPVVNETECSITQIPSANNGQLRDHAMLYESYTIKDNKPHKSESGKAFLTGKKTNITLL